MRDSDEKRGAGNIPDQKELEKELSEYLSKKYGNRIKIVSPILFPKPSQEESDVGPKTAPAGWSASSLT